jgi:hypothetical protein
MQKMFTHQSHFYEIFLVQKMHYLLKHKILRFVFKCLNVHFLAPTCFGPLGPSSGSIHQNLVKVTQQPLHTPQAEMFMHHTTTILTRCFN